MSSRCASFLFFLLDTIGTMKIRSKDSLSHVVLPIVVIDVKRSTGYLWTAITVDNIGDDFNAKLNPWISIIAVT